MQDHARSDEGGRQYDFGNSSFPPYGAKTSQLLVRHPLDFLEGR
jgi:hypothetical protein